MASCLIRGVRSIELVASNLEEASRFYETVWRLAPVATRNDSRYFRATWPTMCSACIAVRDRR